jgi:respiratory burst oxidase
MIWPTIALTIFFIDYLARYLKRLFIRVKLFESKLPTKNAMFLTFRINESISMLPGQYILLQCENISTVEWHPFFITDFVVEPRKTLFTVSIAIRGDWTSELYEKLYKLKMYEFEKSRKRKSKSKRRKTSVPRKLAFLLDGPFPSQAEAILQKERVVLIGCGIGITPYIAIFNYVM